MSNKKRIEELKEHLLNSDAEANKQNKIITEKELLRERRKTIDEEPYKKPFVFWCNDCKLDFGAVAFKYEWTYNRVPYARYESKCKDCNKRVIRYITDKQWDPWFWRSKNNEIQRKKYAKDMLQPGDPGFTTLYGDPYKKVHE